MELIGITNEARLRIIDEIVYKLPVMSKPSKNPAKSCESCSNLGDTRFALNMFWPRHKCKECDGYKNWDHIENLKSEIEKEIRSQ